MQATIYIRKQNEAKWNAIADKSTWINTLLDNSDDTSLYGKVRTVAPEVGPMVTVLSQDLPDLALDATKGTAVSTLRPDNGDCKIHGTPLTDNGKCLQKGCKYA